MTRILTILVATLAVTATLSANMAEANTRVQATRGFLSSGHTTGSNIISGPISGGNLGSGR